MKSVSDIIKEVNEMIEGGQWFTLNMYLFRYGYDEKIQLETIAAIRASYPFRDKILDWDEHVRRCGKICGDKLKGIHDENRET